MSAACAMVSSSLSAHALTVLVQPTEHAVATEDEGVIVH